MEIIYISSIRSFPARGGGEMRVEGIAKGLAKVSQLTFLSPDDSKAVDIGSGKHIRIGKDVKSATLSPKSIWTVLSVVRKSKAQNVIFAANWGFVEALLVKLFTDKTVSYDSQNVEADIYPRRDSFFSYIRWILALVSEYIMVKSSDYVFVTSEVDREGFKKRYGLGDDQIVSAYNGTDTQRFKPNRSAGKEIVKQYKLDPDVRIVLFMGSLSYHPNAQALDIIYEQLLSKIKENNAVLFVVGKYKKSFDLTKYEDKDVIITGYVTDEEATQFHQGSDVTIVPLLSGGGTRLKILDAIACGSYIVSTTKGAEGIDRKACEPNLKVTDDWEEFAELMFAHNKTYSVSDRFLNLYSWDKIANNIVNEIS